MGIKPAAYRPAVSILQERVALSKSFSALRRVRPRVPFWQLAAHRIPTLWTLYRGLMREAPGDDIRWRMRMLFERYRSLTSPTATRDKLVTAHKYLDIFRIAKEGDGRLQRVLARYNAMIAAKRDKVRMKSILLKEWAWQERLRNRPILTGGYLRPSYLNGPLPRMKPQPVAVSMIMRNRRLARERRGAKYIQLVGSREDLYHEGNFEETLSKMEGAGAVTKVFRNDEWNRRVTEQQAAIRESLSRDSERARMPYPPKMLTAVKEARREKVRNKTRERERERRGEVLRRTLERRRQRPPAHLLAVMTKEQRRMDRVIRGISEVGYVAMTKKRLGRKLNDEETWKILENGRKEDRVRLDLIDLEIKKANEGKRKEAGEGVP